VTVIVVGAGINGVTSAIALKKRGHNVVLLDPGPVPHPLAASNDISKAVRGAYGSDEFYTEMAERAIPIWREWNRVFDAELYHEVGFLFMRKSPMAAGDFESETARVFQSRGRVFERINRDQLGKRFPAWNADRYCEGVLERDAGYVEAGRALERLIELARLRGVVLRDGIAFAGLAETDNGVGGVILENGDKLAADAVVIAAGSWTPQLLPFLRTSIRATGHPVFHLRPKAPELFAEERFPVFGADIAMTGYYGFPVNGNGVVKIGNHGPGREVISGRAELETTEEDENNLRVFLGETFPALADAPLVSTRVCPYCDTNDGHFWIARDPERQGLTVAAGDNGHGFKFAPILGDLIADAMEGRENDLLGKFRWRPEVEKGTGKEAARHL
jgi:glycine/D-amino acid oxidase-like deaminating enzyme